MTGGERDQSLARIEANQERIEEKLDTMNGSISAILMEIGGVPDPRYRDSNRRSLRARVHEMENDRSVERAIHDAYSRSWSVSQKSVLFAFALIAAVDTLLRLLGVGG